MRELEADLAERKLTLQHEQGQEEQGKSGRTGGGGGGGGGWRTRGISFTYHSEFSGNRATYNNI